jgi:hypothetical protein
MTSTLESLPALGICLEEYEYPYPVRFLPLTNDLQQVTMGYMDIPPGTEPNGKTVVLMHGKAFGGYYFRNVIEALTTSGYRVGSVAHRLVPAVKAATGVQRVYLLAVMERAPHFHLWFVPKKDEGELRGADYLAQRPPLTASYSDAEAMSIKIREQFEQS